jgi:hypothetical protein
MKELIASASPSSPIVTFVPTRLRSEDLLESYSEEGLRSKTEKPANKGLFVCSGVTCADIEFHSIKRFVRRRYIETITYNREIIDTRLRKIYGKAPLYKECQITDIILCIKELDVCTPERATQIIQSNFGIKNT